MNALRCFGTSSHGNVQWEKSREKGLDETRRGALLRNLIARALLESSGPPYAASSKRVASAMSAMRCRGLRGGDRYGAHAAAPDSPRVSHVCP